MAEQLDAQENLILGVQEEIAAAMARAVVDKAELARRLGKTRGYVTQILSSGRNLTLRTWSDVATALGCRIEVWMVNESADRIEKEAS